MSVSFIGAGPGDADLITVKGLGRLRAADVVLHDRLVAPDLLREARADAELIDVGKAPGRHCMEQARINELLVERARRHASVVRLKGGDPGVFGRLGEEIRALRAAGISFEIVPGVTAACAAAARAGISLTERSRSSMVVLASGSAHDGTAHAGDWGRLARTDCTLVFYMPVARLPSIARTLVTLGRDPGEPAIVVERVAMPQERILAATLASIEAVAREAGVESPAILITGPTIDAATAPLEAYAMLAGAPQ